MGSGIAIKKAIKKYGLENFRKEILFYFETFEEMNQKEAEIVNEEYVSRNDTYNLKTGGSSGIPGKETRKKMSSSGKQRSPVSEETRKKMSEVHLGVKKSKEVVAKITNAHRNRSEETRKKISEAHSGKILSNEHIEKMSIARRERQRASWGNKNILKIDSETDAIVEKYYYVAETGYCGTNILSAIKRNGTAYGYKWRLE